MNEIQKINREKMRERIETNKNRKFKRNISIFYANGVMAYYPESEKSLSTEQIVELAKEVEDDLDYIIVSYTIIK